MGNISLHFSLVLEAHPGFRVLLVYFLPANSESIPFLFQELDSPPSSISPFGPPLFLSYAAHRAPSRETVRRKLLSKDCATFPPRSPSMIGP